jgi:indolepyruvate ferredoxin oxidoreductase alpha subunit
MSKVFLLGNAAIARGVWEAGVTFAAAYPGTPSTEIMENIANYSEIDSRWCPNEKVAMETAIGASLGGARAFVCMKHVGLNVAADPFMTVTYTGVGGGLVICVADDPGMHSSQNEQDTRIYGKFAKVPVFEPSNAQEAKEMTALAFKVSEDYDTPVIVRTTTRISHGSGIVWLEDRQAKAIRKYHKDMAKWVMMPAMARKRHTVIEERLLNLADYADKLHWQRVEELPQNDLGVIASGAAYKYVKDALPAASVLKLDMVYPLPKDAIFAFAAKVKRLVVVEELEPFITDQLRAWGIECQGKELFSLCGEFDVPIVRKAIMGEDADLLVSREPCVDIPPRPPVLCSGCPHRGAFLILRQLKAVVIGDIGCYTLGALPPLSAMDTTVCMGASIGMAAGMSRVVSDQHKHDIVAVIGDSTFFHSGLTGLLDAVYNHDAITVLILDNTTTGMTGHQDHPGTGLTLSGEITEAADISAIAKAMGVKRIREVDPLDLTAIEVALKEEMAADELSVIIAKRTCALLVKPERHPYVVNSELCRGCNECALSGCPSIRMKNRKAVIADTCTGCGLCLQLCRFEAIMGGEPK